MAFPFLQRGNLIESARHLSLASETPSIALENLVTGIDNVRHDVFLSPKFADVARAHLFRLMAKHGDVEELASEPLAPARSVGRIGPVPSMLGPRAADPADYRRLLAELHMAALNRAKTENNFMLDLLFRLAVIKFLRTEMLNQYNRVLERCRARVKLFEGPREPNSPRALAVRERFSSFQVNKKAVMRRAGQDLFLNLREIEKETVAKTRRSLFGEAQGSAHDYFLNRLIFAEDARDDFLNAEHYVMLGNYERDPDRFQSLLEISAAYLKSLGVVGEGEEFIADAILNVPDNAQEIMAAGTPDESTPKGKAQRVLLNAWLERLEREGVMEHVLASYEAAPLLAQYFPPVNPQQLKNALIVRSERKRVESLLEEHGKMSADGLNQAVKKVEGCKGVERAKVAGRFFADFIRYHRDFRRMEALTTAMDSVNILTSAKFRELSAINNTLYEFLLPEEQKPAEDKVISHVVLKADIRESTTLTRTLSERGLNPASYFSLNFYDPINKLLPKYDARKVFIEGDAVILALFEYEGGPGLGVARACVLAKEIIEIVTAYNERSLSMGLPSLELGIGVTYEDSAPMYLMDGNQQIMISRAINESDRLSSCSKGMRKLLEGRELLFNVFAFKTVEDAHTGGNPDEFLLRYNIGGIHINEAAFQKLRGEVSLQGYDLQVPMIWGTTKVRVYSGVVPVGQGLFHRIVVRHGRVAHIDVRDFSLKQTTDRSYYEVCTHPQIYAAIERAQETAEAAAT
ncbi:MAG TPA: hypothetical protein VN176_07975 [Verrucomicrobiae bacterium]|nr:hypothetical protein [Verrucomicrobiae bacterium]